MLTEPVEKRAGFWGNVLLNPKTPELNQAFSLYEKKTGKSRNDMSHKDIGKYIKMIREQRQSLKGSMEKSSSMQREVMSAAIEGFHKEACRVGYSCTVEEAVEAIEKQAALTGELAGTFINPINMGLNIPAALVAALGKKTTDEEIAAQDERGWSNIIPGVGPYRLARRIRHKLEGNEAE